MICLKVFEHSLRYTGVLNVHIAGLREDLEEVTEKEKRLVEENAEVDRLLETMNERLEFYDNQVIRAHTAQ